MRIIRTLILVGAAGLLLPSPPEDKTVPAAGDQQPSTLELLTSAGAAASDAASFCSRQPEVCAVAGYLTERLTAKVVYSASLIWGWADERTGTGDGGAGPFAALRVAGPVPDSVADPGNPGQSTLELDDLIPEWRGPVAEGGQDS
jgi:hypothetical protein